MPTAWPLTAAITGLRTSHAGGVTPAALNDPSSRRSKVVPPEPMSAPAQKAGGVPVRTTARTSSSASHDRYASPSSRAMRALKALRTSGRFRVMVATPRSTVTSSVR